MEKWILSYRCPNNADFLPQLNIFAITLSSMLSKSVENIPDIVYLNPEDKADMFMISLTTPKSANDFIFLHNSFLFAY